MLRSQINPVPLSQLESLLNEQDLRPPQSYLSLETNIDWTRAVSVAELLHNRFWVYRVGPEAYESRPPNPRI